MTRRCSLAERCGGVGVGDLPWNYCNIFNVTFISNGFHREIRIEENRRKNTQSKRKRRENWEPPEWRDDVSYSDKMDFQNLIRFCTSRRVDGELHTNAKDFVFLPIRVYRLPKRMRYLSLQTSFLGIFFSPSHHRLFVVNLSLCQFSCLYSCRIAVIKYTNRPWTVHYLPLSNSETIKMCVTHH